MMTPKFDENFWTTIKNMSLVLHNGTIKSGD